MRETNIERKTKGQVKCQEKDKTEIMGKTKVEGSEMGRLTERNMGNGKSDGGSEREDKRESGNTDWRKKKGLKTKKERRRKRGERKR